MKYVERKLYRPTNLALLPMTTWNSLEKKKKKEYSIKVVKTGSRAEVNFPFMDRLKMTTHGKQALADNPFNVRPAALLNRPW